MEDRPGDIKTPKQDESIPKVEDTGPVQDVGDVPDPEDDDLDDLDGMCHRMPRADGVLG